jgi:predicted Zn-dependent protease
MSRRLNMRLSRLIAPTGLAAATAALALAGCAYNETLGRSQVLLVDEGQLAQAAAAAWTQSLSSQRLSSDPVLNRRVTAVGSRLVQAAGVGGQQWEYRVFVNEQPNAFVLPGGRVGVNTGLFKVVQNDDQLAAVLGHEIAHSTLRHSAERYSQTTLAQIGLGVAESAAGSRSPNMARAISTFGSAGAQLGYLLPFSRQHELEADRIGVDYMARAGFRPSQAVELWRNMAAQASRSAPPQFLSTHPSDATRIQQLEAYIRSRGYA